MMIRVMTIPVNTIVMLVRKVETSGNVFIDVQDVATMSHISIACLMRYAQIQSYNGITEVQYVVLAIVFIQNN